MRSRVALIVCLAAVATGHALSADAVDIRARFKETRISADRQPAFTLTFKNLTNDYINLYNVGAYWKWHIEFEPIWGRSGLKQAWELQFDVAGAYMPIMHEQLMPGGEYVLNVDLNDPAYTFVYAPSLSSLKRVRRLEPGKYSLRVTVTLEPPFTDAHEWTGPFVVQSSDLQIMPAKVDKPDKAKVAKWNAAIDEVIKTKIDPHGLWQNGGFVKIELPASAAADDVVAAAVNRNILESKAYSVYLYRDLKDSEKKTAVLLRVGSKDYVLIYYYLGSIGWWSRFYEAKIG